MNTATNYAAGLELHMNYIHASFTLIWLTETTYFTSPLFYTNSHDIAQNALLNRIFDNVLSVNNGG